MPGYLREQAEGGPSIRIVSRQDWGALEPRKATVEELELQTLEIPMSHVTYVHTGTEECNNDEDCIRIIRKIQTDQMDIVGLPDIIFNFMIGGNGVVYEGRGWRVEPHRPVLYQYLKGKGVEVAYIGHYEDVPPSLEMMRTAFDLVLYGIKTKLLKPSFQSIHLA